MKIVSKQLTLKQLCSFFNHLFFQASTEKKNFEITTFNCLL